MSRQLDLLDIPEDVIQLIVTAGIEVVKQEFDSRRILRKADADGEPLDITETTFAMFDRLMLYAMNLMIHSLVHPIEEGKQTEALDEDTASKAVVDCANALSDDQRTLFYHTLMLAYTFGQGMAYYQLTGFEYPDHDPAFFEDDGLGPEDASENEDE